MKAPKARDSLSWGKRRGQIISPKDVELVSAAVSSLNKFENDGNFLREFHYEQQKSNPDSSASSHAHHEKYVESKLDSSEINRQSEVSAAVKQPLSANQLAAKVMQLRMKGKHKEAEELLKEAENIKENQIAENDSIRLRNDGGTSKNLIQRMSVQRKEEDADMHLAQKIVQNKKFSISGQADDEYDFEDGPRTRLGKRETVVTVNWLRITVLRSAS